MQVPVRESLGVVKVYFHLNPRWWTPPKWEL